MHNNPFSDNTLTLPKVKEEDNLVKFDLTDIYSALSRQEEIAFITKDKAPELLVVFLKAFTLSKKYLAAARYEFERSKIHQKRVYSILSKDKIPGLLRELGMKDTERNVSSLINLEPEFQEIEERTALLDAIVEDLEGKTKALDMLQQAVKKIYTSYQPDIMIQSKEENSFIGRPKYKF